MYREILYERVPMSRRVLWHRHIGRRLETGYGPQAREMAPELAEHFVRGRDTARAVPYLYYAGQHAMQRSAHHEALRHFTQALELLATLPDTPGRQQQELDLLVAFGPVCIVLKGYASGDVEHFYRRARALCQQIGETPQLTPVLWGLVGLYLVRSQLQVAQEIGTQLLTLAQRQEDPMLLLAGHFAMGMTWCCMGAFGLACEHFAQRLACHDPQSVPGYVSRFGLDLAVFCRSWAAHALWHLGYPEQALTMSRTALAEASQGAHPFSLALTLAYAAILHQFRREASLVHEYAAALRTLCQEQGFTYYLAWATTLQGWALAARGQEAEGLAQLGHGVSSLRATGAAVRLPYYLALQAEGYGAMGQYTAGLDVLTEVLTQTQHSGECWGEAEVYRLQGEFLWRSSGLGVGSEAAPGAAAAACFHQALTMARQQQARSLELRAAMSLARLWQGQGKPSPAHALLAAVYNGFTEGFDTTDLRAAQTLLQALASA